MGSSFVTGGILWKLIVLAGNLFTPTEILLFIGVLNKINVFVFVQKVSGVFRGKL